jgi:hypothetical protein
MEATMNASQRNGHSLAVVVAPEPIAEDDLDHGVVCLRLSLGHRVSDTAMRRTRASKRFGELARSILESKVDARKEWLWEWISRRKGRAPFAADAQIIERSLREAQEIVKVQPDDMEEDQADKPFDLGVLGTQEFASKKFPRVFLVDGVLVARRPAIFAGPKKALKTSLLIELLVALAYASDFLGKFRVRRRIKVLLISGESGEATIQETLRRVCRSKGINPDDLDGFAFWGFKLPFLGSPEQVEVLSAFIRENGIEVVIIDPVYLCLMGAGPKIDPANLFDVGPLLKRVSDACLDAGATPIFAHHFRKNRDSPFDPPDMEDMAFAGFQEFARQWVLIGRRKRYEPGSGQHDLWITVGGSDGHSGEWSLDVNEGVTDNTFQDRQWDLTINRAADARIEAKAKAEEAKVETLSAKEKIKAEAKEAGNRKAIDQALEIIGGLPKRQTTIRTLRDRTGWNQDKATYILGRLVAAKVLAEVEIPTAIGSRAVRNFPGFQMTEGVAKC